MSEHVEIGAYNKRMMLHVDDGEPAIRWMAAIGVGSTLGFNGRSRLSATRYNPGINTDVAQGDVSSFEKVRVPEGTVSRIRTFGDVHTWPDGEGARMYIQSTLFVGITKKIFDA